MARSPKDHVIPSILAKKHRPSVPTEIVAP